MLAGRIGRDDGLCTPLAEPVSQTAGIVGPVGNQTPRRWNNCQQIKGPVQIMGVARRQREGDRPAFGICQSVDLGRAPAARAADGLAEGPPFAPAADRCALT